MKIRSFEELNSWKKARILTNMIYDFTEKSRFSQDRGLKDQITRAAVSIMSNIAEGFERGSNTEFIQFLFIAKASAGEVRSQFYVCLDRKYITQQEFNQAVSLVKQISGHLMKLIDYLKGAKITGIKHKKPVRKPWREEVSELWQELGIEGPKEPG
jgi:four helix bundle protein